MEEWNPLGEQRWSGGCCGSCRTEHSSCGCVWMHRKKQNEMPQLCSAVIHMVLSAVKQFCGAIELNENLIHPEELLSYPLRNIGDLFKYFINRLASMIMERKEVITVKVGERFKTIEIDELVYFESYTSLSDKLMAFLYSGDDSLDQPIPDSFLLDFASSAYLKQSKLKEILSFNESELAGAVAQCDEQYKADQRHQCFLLLRTWRDSNENTTYNGLRKLLDSFSIFCGRNPLVSYAIIIVLHANCMAFNSLMLVFRILSQ